MGVGPPTSPSHSPARGVASRGGGPGARNPQDGRDRAGVSGRELVRPR